MASAQDIIEAARRRDASIEVTPDAAEFLTQLAPYQVHATINSLLNEAKRNGITTIDLAYLKDIGFAED